MSDFRNVRLKVGLEIHVELATRRKMFTRVGSPACAEFDGAEPNTLIDPVVLGLPGALPVLNKRAIEMSMSVGLALGCRIAPFTKWDRKSYYYPDLPKNYQISQYDLPLCFDGAVDVPDPADPTGETSFRVGIIRAHLEEDSGKLLHEWPGGRAIDFSIVDLNRAGTPLLEIVTAPDFRNADQVVAFAQMLRNWCRYLGVTEGVMQKGHMRFEPNINVSFDTGDGRHIVTPIVEIKNLNSFKALRGAIEFEFNEQPLRWQRDGRTMGPGAKSTRGWDDQKNQTVLQREKEDAHDYRYFPDPDLLPVTIDEAWVGRIAQTIPELPHARARRYESDFALGRKEAAALVEERATVEFFEAAVAHATGASGGASGGGGAPGVTPGGVERERAGKMIANILMQSGFKRANEGGLGVHELGITPARLAELALLRLDDSIGSSAADALFGHLCAHDEAARDAAERLGLLQVKDDAALEGWCRQTIDDPANSKVVADVKGGKEAAVGRLVGGVMKLSGGKADAKVVREMMLKMLGSGQ